MLHGKSKDVMGKVLAELVDYTVSHFAAEEGYMKNHSFLGFDAHKKEHDDLAKQAAVVLSDFRSGKTVLSMAVMDFLKDWLYKHILKTDMLYVSHLIAKGVNSHAANRRRLRGRVFVQLPVSFPGGGVIIPPICRSKERRA